MTFSLFHVCHISFLLTLLMGKTGNLLFCNSRWKELVNINRNFILFKIFILISNKVFIIFVQIPIIAFFSNDDHNDKVLNVDHMISILVYMVLGPMSLYMCHPSSVIHHVLSAICHPSSVASCTSSVIPRLSSIVHRLPTVINNPSTVVHLSSVIRHPALFRH